MINCAFNGFKKSLKSKLKGYSLIELMVVCSIVAILSSFAFASYTEQVRKSRLADLKEDVASISIKLEQKFFLQNTFPAEESGNSLPPDINARHTDYFNYNYFLVMPAANSYTVTGTGNPRSNLNMWAATNSQGTRCYCYPCLSTIPTLLQEAITCPNGTSDW